MSDSGSDSDDEDWIAELESELCSTMETKTVSKPVAKPESKPIQVEEYSDDDEPWVDVESEDIPVRLYNLEQKQGEAEAQKRRDEAYAEYHSAENTAKRRQMTEDRNKKRWLKQKEDNGATLHKRRRRRNSVLPRKEYNEGDIYR